MPKVESRTLEEFEQLTYSEMFAELRYHLPHIFRAVQLIPLMYNRLTLVDGLTHDQAIVKMKQDFREFRDIKGFSLRNIYRYLPQHNPNVPHRNRIAKSPELKGPRILDIVITTDARVDPEHPNVIIDRDNVITVENRFDWKADKIFAECRDGITKISHDADLRLAFCGGGVMSNGLNEMLPPEERMKLSYEDVWVRMDELWEKVNSFRSARLRNYLDKRSKSRKP